MALQISLTAAQNPIGIDLPAVYCRVHGLTNASDTQATVLVSFFATAEARAANKTPLFDKSYVMTQFDLVNPIAIKATLYAFLKTQVDFAACQDV